MPNVKISELPSVESIDPTSLIPAVKSGDTVHITHAGLLNHSALTETNTVLNTDTIPVLQNGEMKKIKTSKLVDISGFPDASSLELTDFLVVNRSEGNTKINIEDFVDSITEEIRESSTTSPGIIAIATLPEVQSGTNNTDAVVPSTLKAIADTKANVESPSLTGTPTVPTAPAATNTTQIASTAFTISEINRLVPTASESVSGKVELATSAETKAGSATNRAIHPSGLASCFSTLVGTDTGCQEFFGGFIVQWGKLIAPNVSNATVAFPKKFPTECYGACVTMVLPGDNSGIDAAPALRDFPSTTHIFLDLPTGSDKSYFWFAWGR